MIGEFLLDIVFGIITSIFDLFNFSDLELSFQNITENFWHTDLWEFLNVILYFLPVGTIFDILCLILTVTMIRAVIRLIITVWDLLPIA